MKRINTFWAFIISLVIVILILFFIVLLPPGMTPEQSQAEERAPGVINTYPLHNQKLTSIPPEVTITVDKSLLEPSELTIFRNRHIVGGAGGIFSDDKLTMRSTVMPNHGWLESVNGLYTVRYRVCYEQIAGCQNGVFQFNVDTKEK